MKTKLLSIAAVTALFFTSCNNDGDNIEVNDGRVLFSSGVTATTTRVSGEDGDLWDSNDPIGIYMVETGTTTVAENAKNVLYTATPSTPATTATFSSTAPIYYPVDGSAVDFIAYYPYKASLTSYTYPVDVSDQSSPATIDLLYAETNTGTTGGYSKTSGSVNLPFNHQLSKVVLNVKAGTGVTILVKTDLSIAITGMNTSADFNLATKTLTPFGTSKDISPTNIADKTGGYYSFQAILLPATLNNTHKVQFTVDSKTYTWEIINTISKLESGKEYVYDVTVSKTGLSVSPVEITDWTGTTATGTATKRGIRTAAELVQFSTDWNTTTNAATRATVIKKWSHDGTSTGTIRLLADIDMSGAGNFTSIGNTWNSNDFSAMFDGCGYTVSDLTVSGATSAGLFGFVRGGSISRVSVVDGIISGTYYAGGIAGYNLGNAVTGCSVSYTTVTVTGPSGTAGGIAGYVQSSSSVTGCSVTGGTVTGDNAGGIAGYVSSSSVTGCIAAPANVSGTYKGVVAGYLYNSSITAVCWVDDISGVNAVGGGSGTNLMPFASAFGDFFTTGSPSPIDKMNTAISSSGYQWVAQASGVLPKIGKK